jgi:hypothetical protein
LVPSGAGPQMKTRPMGIIERVRLGGRGALPGDAATGCNHGIGGLEICRDRLALRKFNGGDRPLPIMALDRDPQAVKFVKPDILYRTSLSVP